MKACAKVASDPTPVPLNPAHLEKLSDLYVPESLKLDEVDYESEINTNLFEVLLCESEKHEFNDDIFMLFETVLELNQKYASQILAILNSYSCKFIVPEAVAQKGEKLTPNLNMILLSKLSTGQLPALKLEMLSCLGSLIDANKTDIGRYLPQVNQILTEQIASDNNVAQNMSITALRKLIIFCKRVDEGLLQKLVDIATRSTCDEYVRSEIALTFGFIEDKYNPVIPMKQFREKLSLANLHFTSPKNVLEQLKCYTNVSGALLDGTKEKLFSPLCIEKCQKIMTESTTFKEIIQKLHQLAVDNHFQLEGKVKNLNELLDELQDKNKSESELVRKLMEQNYLNIEQFIFQEHSDKLTWNEKQIVSWAEQVKLKFGKTFTDCEAIAVIYRANYLVNGHNLTYPQILCSLIALKTVGSVRGKLLEVATGEGKSTIISILAIIHSLRGENVDIITSSPILAERDAKQQAKLYEMFDLKCSDNSDKTIYLKGKKNCYSAAIVYGEMSQFQFDILRDNYSKLNTLGGRKFGVAIVDEVDSMLIDDSSKIARLSSTVPGIDHFQALYVFIWQHLVSIKSKLIMVNNKLYYVKGTLGFHDGTVTLEFADENGDIMKITDLEVHLAQTGGRSPLAEVVEDAEEFLRNSLMLYLKDVMKQNTIYIPSHFENFVEKQNSLAKKSYRNVKINVNQADLESVISALYNKDQEFKGLTGEMALLKLEEERSCPRVLGLTESRETSLVIRSNYDYKFEEKFDGKQINQLVKIVEEKLENADLRFDMVTKTSSSGILNVEFQDLNQKEAEAKLQFIYSNSVHVGLALNNSDLLRLMNLDSSLASGTLLVGQSQVHEKLNRELFMLRARELREDRSFCYVRFDDLTFDQANKVVKNCSENAAISLSFCEIADVFNAALKGQADLSVAELDQAAAKKVIQELRKRNVEFSLEFENLSNKEVSFILNGANIEQEDMNITKVKNVRDLFTKGSAPDYEINQFAARGLEHIVELNEKLFIPWRSVAAVAALCFCQIVIGSVMMATGIGSIFSGGILAEGVADMITAFCAYKTRQFNWRNYAIQKAANLAVSACTMGLIYGKVGLNVSRSARVVLEEAGVQVGRVMTYRTVMTTVGILGKNMKSLAVKLKKDGIQDLSDFSFALLKSEI
ncbi:hypothetical protein HAZT_HAZT003726 [Hyalella azteca]|uniref:Uncharacterized protein n=1 Tax=Hyalella azteca TaxID=294128 RepID=A0A6A0H1T9_HYAAZ|nr:hypothetical protein HAZT_HAZT003726 [Hyalella azteca]